MNLDSCSGHAACGLAKPGRFATTGHLCNITGNYIDRAGGPGIALLARDEQSPCLFITVTGNVIYRDVDKPIWASAQR